MSYAWPIRPALISAFSRMLQPGLFVLPPSPSQSIPPGISFAGIHSYFWVKRGTVEVVCLTQEKNTRLQPGLKLGLLNAEFNALLVKVWSSVLGIKLFKINGRVHYTKLFHSLTYRILLLTGCISSVFKQQIDSVVPA